MCGTESPWLFSLWGFLSTQSCGSPTGPSHLSEGLRLPACEGGALLGLCRSLGPSCLGPARAGWWFSFLIVC